MLKQLLLALPLAVAALPALAQQAPAGHYQYCNLVSFGTIGRNAELDYGQHAKTQKLNVQADAVYGVAETAVAARNTELEALNEVVKKLDSPVLALNYLTNHGWEYLGTASLSGGPAIIYTLRRRTP